MGLRGGGVSTVFLLLWWGAWLRVTPPAALRLSRALSDLRTGPVAWTGQVVQRRTVESESYGPESSTDTLPVLALDVGGGQVRLLVVDDDVHRRMPPGTLVRALVTPRLCHLVSVEAVPTPGGVGLPPAGPGPARA
jgi:hypothetical protein